MCSSLSSIGPLPSISFPSPLSLPALAFLLVAVTQHHCSLSLFNVIFMPPRNVIGLWPETYCVCPVLPLVCASVRPCLRPETLLTRCLAEYLTHFHQTYITMRYGTEINASQFGVKSSKVKVTVE